VSSETLFSQKFLSKSVVCRSKNEKISLFFFCAAFFLLADFLVHFLSLKKGSLGVV